MNSGDLSQISLGHFIEHLQGRDYLILDTETTGLYQGEIVQIAIINSAGDTLLDTLVKPANGIPREATAIHGISMETVKDAPSWADVAPMVLNIIKGQKVVVYNAIYDRKMMHQSGEAVGMAKIDWKAESAWYCAMTAYAEHYGAWNEYKQSYTWQKLVTACRKEGVTVENAHSALGDCLMTLGVVRAMVAVVNDGD